ncbi:DUF350 domain-containing protein [Oryzomicrobium sp.]|uniref:DUF350 domain-containing protein n=1 Tax=Oryzomicrobium sp. TaxID=1911578 RepID=UPI00260145CC|nr:DUF350 domain-containing protein [Oryzomicrobium sp.]MCE1244361.1 DUF350 domain-containing protein [Oryzomicrobium sp.]
MAPVIAFLQYFSAAVVLLLAFAALYVKVTPYDDFALIRENNSAAAISLGGAMLGFTFPLMAAIYYTHDLVEMLKWAAITGAVQLVIFAAMRRYARRIEEGCTAPAILMACAAVAIGLLNGVCISY